MARKHAQYLTAVVIALSMAFTTMPATSVKAAEPVVPMAETPAEQRVLIERLDAIRHINKKALSRTERKALRKETRALKKKLDRYGGVYISAGALVVIILLILLL